MTDAWGEAEPAPVAWQSGPWSLWLRGDELADVTFDGTLVLRSIRAVVRDRDWQTVPMTVVSVSDSTRLVVTVLADGLGARIPGTITVEPSEGELRVSYSAESSMSFWRNRVGLVVLHPPTLAGIPLTVTAPSGFVLATEFPTVVAPHQPALDIARLAYVADGVRTELDFAGDIFEMEDQRNWTDASYKTYSTPLSLPFPVELAVGDRIEQSVTVRCDRVGERAPQKRGMPRLVPAGHLAPSLGVGASTAPGPGPAASVPADFVLVELEAATPTWPAALARAVSDADGLPLDVRIVADHPAQVAEVLDAIAGAVALQVGAVALRVGVFSSASGSTTPELWGGLVEGLAARGIPALPLGGTRAHFTELNRTRPAEPTALAFSITPQMHAVETAQLVESIAMQRLVAESAVRIGAGRPVHVGPITLRSRYNAVSTSPAPVSPVADLSLGYGAELVAGATDPRQPSEALAAWTIASYAALAITGVESVTYFEAWGPRGLRDAGGGPWPVATAIGWLHELSGELLLVGRGLPDGVWMLAASVGGVTTVLAANLSGEAQRLDVLLPGGGTVAVDIPSLRTRVR